MLVIGASPEALEAITRSLTPGFQVLESSTESDGLATARQAQPALIVLDASMAPLVDSLRAERQLAPTPILVVTPHVDDWIGADVISARVQDFVTWPFKDRDFRLRVQTLLRAQIIQERSERETEIFETLYRVGTSFAQELDQQKLLQLVTDEATKLTGADFGAFFFNDTREDGNAYLLYTLSGVPPEAFAKFPMPRATPLFGPTFRGEGIIRSDDVRKDPRYGRWGPQPKGHLPVVSYLAVPVRGREGVVHGGLFFGHGQPGRFTDVHERIVNGLAAQAAAALEKARLVKALRASEARAREADRRKDEFLAMLGHELRNPLAPITTALQLMKLRGNSATLREQQMIERQLQHITRLVDDLLDIARVTRGKIPIEKQRLEISAVVEKAVEVVSPLLEQRRHRFEVNVPRTGLAVDADPGRLAQVLANLLTNAAKYTDPGGSIRLSAQRADHRVRICVADDGQGIAPELLANIFELFVQGDRTIDRAEGGLGIGLALVRSLVELHGGSVSAKSEGPGKGSEFIVELPVSVAAPAEAPEPTRATAPSPPAKASRVLVVDDNVDAAEILSDALRELGHDVVVAHDPATALKTAQQFRADTALLDIGLPVMDGYELARRLRELWGSDQVKFVAITGYGQRSDKQRAMASGFDAHLVKPVDLDKLLQVIGAL